MCTCFAVPAWYCKVSSVSNSNLGEVFLKKNYFASVKILFESILKIQNKILPWNYFKIENKILLCILKTKILFSKHYFAHHCIGGSRVWNLVAKQSIEVPKASSERWIHEKRGAICAEGKVHEGSVTPCPLHYGGVWRGDNALLGNCYLFFIGNGAFCILLLLSIGILEPSYTGLQKWI